MTIYLYDKNTKQLVATYEEVIDYTDEEVKLYIEEPSGEKVVGFIRDIADIFEFSSKEDLSETLRADYRNAHPSDADRMEQLEDAIAALFRGDV